MRVELIKTFESFPVGRSFAATEIDDARKHLSSFLIPHQLSMIDEKEGFSAFTSYAKIDTAITLLYHRFVSRVCTRPAITADFFLLRIPIRGEAILTTEGMEILTNPMQATIVCPNSNAFMTSITSCDSLIVKVERTYLERCLELQIGRSLEKELEFSPAVPLTSPQSKELIDLLSFIIPSLINKSGMSRARVARKNMESLLMNGIITCLDHNYSHKLFDIPSNITPAYMFRAQKYVRDNLLQEIQPDDIAKEVGVGTRTLFSGFRDYLETTPMRYLKDLRLNQAHWDLLHAEKRNESVTSIATKCGFQHLSHFGAAYKKKFGETPQDTLNRYDGM